MITDVGQLTLPELFDASLQNLIPVRKGRVRTAASARFLCLGSSPLPAPSHTLALDLLQFLLQLPIAEQGVKSMEQHVNQAPRHRQHDGDRHTLKKNFFHEVSTARIGNLESEKPSFNPQPQTPDAAGLEVTRNGRRLRPGLNEN